MVTTRVYRRKGMYRKKRRTGKASIKSVPKATKAYVKSKLKRVLSGVEVKRHSNLNVINVGGTGMTIGTIYHVNPISLIPTNSADVEGIVGRSFKTLGFKLSVNCNNVGAYLDGIVTKTCAPKGDSYIRIIGFTTSAFTNGASNSVFLQGYSSTSDYAMGRYNANNDAINKNIDKKKFKVFYDKKIKFTPSTIHNDTAFYDVFNTKGHSYDKWIPYRRNVKFEANTSGTGGQQRIMGEQVYFACYGNVDWLTINASNWISLGRITMSVDTYYTDM